MPALNFQTQFAQPVEDNIKQTTIRTERKRPFRRGDTVYLYTGMRTKNCRKLGEGTLSHVVPIEVQVNGITLAGFWLSRQECDAIARADGFEDFSAMQGWFVNTHGPMFRGQWMSWGLSLYEILTGEKIPEIETELTGPQHTYQT